MQTVCVIFTLNFQEFSSITTSNFSSIGSEGPIKNGCHIHNSHKFLKLITQIELNRLVVRIVLH